MDALLSTPQARRVALTALVLALASLAEAGAPVESIEQFGYVDPSIATVVSRARNAALRKLGVPKCQQLFSEFTDLSGVPLDQVLAAAGETAESRLARMAFLDGTRVPPCGRRDVYAFTKPGSLSIQLCRNFRKLAGQNAASAANLLIHEMLHSLGTGEAPHTGVMNGYEITARVESRCGQ